MTQEILTMEQLESVSGGSWSETKVDTAFLMQLDYSITNTITIKKAFAENGIDFENYPSPLNNDYSIKGQKYPHWAALGYVLKKETMRASTATGLIQIIQNRSSKNIFTFVTSDN